MTRKNKNYAKSVRIAGYIAILFATIAPWLGWDVAGTLGLVAGSLLCVIGLFFGVVFVMYASAIFTEGEKHIE